MTKFKKKGPDEIEAVQFDPQGEWPDFVIPWSMKARPRDMSWGYIEVMGGKIHLLAGDWIFKDESGNYTALHSYIFDKMYEPIKVKEGNSIK